MGALCLDHCSLLSGWESLRRKDEMRKQGQHHGAHSSDRPSWSLEKLEMFSLLQPQLWHPYRPVPVPKCLWVFFFFLTNPRPKVLSPISFAFLVDSFEWQPLALINPPWTEHFSGSVIRTGCCHFPPASMGMWTESTLQMSATAVGLYQVPWKCFRRLTAMSNHRISEGCVVTTALLMREKWIPRVFVSCPWTIWISLSVKVLSLAMVTGDVEEQSRVWWHRKRSACAWARQARAAGSPPAFLAGLIFPTPPQSHSGPATPAAGRPLKVLHTSTRTIGLGPDSSFSLQMFAWSTPSPPSSLDWVSPPQFTPFKLPPSPVNLACLICFCVCLEHIHFQYRNIYCLLSVSSSWKVHCGDLCFVTKAGWNTARAPYVCWINECGPAPVAQWKNEVAWKVANSRTG